MLSFSIAETEVREFMNKLLREDVFDSFEARGVEISSFARFEIDGVSGESCCSWGEMRPYVFNIIKGRRPKAFKIVLSLPVEQARALHENAAAYFLNFMFDGGEILCTAAAAEKSFSLDRAAEGAWQEFVTEFFKSKQITTRRN
ncbi:MAG: DUF5721 family protein [Defluviitaleaceae bacterium]|nr:DUF5721 family protein [Defluviitaleaceae bacterium]